MSIYKLIQNNPVLQELVEEYVKEKMVWRYMEWWFEDHENGQQNWADYWEFLILKRWEHGEMPELWVNRTRFEFEGEGYGPDPKGMIYFVYRFAFTPMPISRYLRSEGVKLTREADAQKTAQELLIEAVEENLPTEEKESGGTTDLAGFDDTLLDTTREGSVTANGLKIKFSVKKEGEYIELDDDEEVEEDADADADADAEEEEEDGSEENETDQGESEDSVKEESATEEGSEEDVEEQPSGVEESEEDEFVDALEDVEDGTEEYYEAGQDYEDSENEDEDDDEDEDEDENDDENEEGEEEEVQSIVISEPAVRHTIKLRFRMPITPPEPKPKIEAEAAKEPKREDDVTGRGIEMGISGGGNQNKRGRDDMEEGVAEDSDEEWTLGGGEGDSSGRRPRKKKRVSWAD